MAKNLNVNDFNDKVRVLLSTAQTEFPAINARLAKSALSLIKDRIINEGVNAKGSKFPKYSTQPLPAFFFIGKGLGSGADKKMEAELKSQRKAGVKNPGVSYEQWRDINNLQTDHVDMKFTGETLKDLDVLETRTEGNVIITVVASKDSITRTNGKKTITTGKITEHLAERYGDFLELSEKETEAIEEAFNEEVQQLFESIFER